MPNPVNLTGTRFGKLTVLRHADVRKKAGDRTAITWLCRCDCGGEKNATTGNLRNGQVKSCGCLHLESCQNRRSGIPKHDITGKRFGRLTAIKFLDFGGKHHNARWLFQCDCGGSVATLTRSVFTGNTTSCGCWNIEKRLKHGMARLCRTNSCGSLVSTVEYTLWGAAKKRAALHKLEFNLQVNDVVIPKVCPVLGIPLVNGIGKVCDGSPTIDRLVPELGYIRENIEVISYRANVIKNYGTADEHRKVAEYIERSLLNRIRYSPSVEVKG